MSPKRAGRPSTAPTSIASLAEEASAPARYLAALETRFEAARRSCGAEDLHLEIAARPILMRFAGSAMRNALAPPFAHLIASEPSDGGSLQIDVWDGESSGVAPPSLPWAPNDVRDLGEVRGFNEGTIRTICDPAYGAITVVDQARGKAMFQVPRASGVPWYERASPLRAALHHLLAPAGATLIHAGAVGSASGGILVAGRSGTGKSTLTAAAASCGMGFAGDDYVALTLDGAPAAHSVHATVKLDEHSLQLLAELGVRPDWAPGAAQPKAVVEIHREFPDSIRRSIPIRAIVAPLVESGKAAWSRAAPMDGLRALAPSTLLQLPSDGGEGLAPMASLARSVPSYSLALGDDPRAAVTALEEVLGDAG